MASTSTFTPTTSRPTIAYIGASRGIGYAAFVALSKSRPDIRHILLLRSIESFKKRVEYTALSEETVQRTTLFEGDAFNEEDVKRLIKEAGEGLEGIVYSVGECMLIRTDVVFDHMILILRSVLGRAS